MIGYLEGTLLKLDEDRILLLCNQVGYEVLLPAFVMESIRTKVIGEALSLYIYFQQTERQPRPVLIGFNLEEEKDFFQLFISVEDIGPLKAVKALTLPIQEIAAAIEADDVAMLKQLKGIGPRTVRKIVATLSGKLEGFSFKQGSPGRADFDQALLEPVLDVLVTQLGHKMAEAKKMIADALERNRGIHTPEELFEEVYRVVE